MATKHKWIDLSAYGIFLGDQRMADGKQRLVVLDMNNIGNPVDLARAGFVPFAGSPRYDRGIYYFEGDSQRLRPTVLAQAFGLDSCPLVEVDREEIDRVFREQTLKKFGANISAVTMRSRILGHNRAGLMVYEGPTGRFVLVSSQNAILENSLGAEKFEKPDFLRSSNAEEVRKCAEGFLWKIRLGNKTGWPDVVSFARTIFEKEGGEKIDPTDEQLHQLQEAIEAAAYEYLTRNAVGLGKTVFERATDFYYGLPAARMRTAESIYLQQYSTPMPLSVVAQKLLLGSDDVTGKSVLEPAAGNGGLINLLPHSMKVCGNELDASRLEALKATGRVKAYQGDALGVSFERVFGIEGGFDYTIANPPFGQLDNPRLFNELRVSRQDYMIALRALEARKDVGRSVFILGADSNQSKGEIKGSSQHFLNYVYDNYEVLGLVELDGRMYSRQGSSFNVRLMVVGDKLPSSVLGLPPSELNILTSYDDLWGWSEHVLSNKYVRASVNVVDVDVPEFQIEAAFGANKKPWERTKTEWESEIQRGEQGGIEDHKILVEQALSEKLPVPDEVLRDYPDLSAHDDRRVNEFQAPYQPASRVGESSTMIPINMAGATYAALNALESRVGAIDAFVADRLNYPLADLGEYFSPEQVDALALGIDAVENNRGIINADQTGVGKGRFVAGMLRYARLCNKTPIFLTITPELFTDIFRDIGDIGSADLFKKLFIFNDGINIKKFGTESEVLYPATTTAEREAALQKGAVDDDVDLVLATYSQFMRAYSKNRKAQLLADISLADSMLVLDESHVAAGSSNLGLTVTQAVINCDAPLYASATPLKGVENFGLYCKVFPASVDLASLPNTLRTGGEALQEAISANMARDGVLIRRELDFSNLVFHTRNPSKERELRNRQLADELAGIISLMSVLSGDVEAEITKLNKQYKAEWEKVPERERKGKRIQASSMNFGSRLYSLNRQFLLGIKIDDAVQTALEDLANGRKPVIAVENTGESLLRQVLSRRLGADVIEQEILELDAPGRVLTEAELERRATLMSSLAELFQNATLDSPPQYRELLEIMLDRISIIKTQGRYGEYTYSKPESEEYQAMEESVREKIRAFPDLPLTPIDIIKKELKQRGFPVAEVSGRKASLRQNEFNEKRWDVAFHQKSDAVANVAGFQNGAYDSIVITRSGSTGISLHATDRFENSDIRQRNFVVAQKASNIAEFLQWMGRVNRKGQVVSPIVTTLESGLPAEMRLTMMHNAKLRKLSANTTSNRENMNLEGEEFDLLNDVGDRVALEWLMENPSIAERLDISLPSDEEESSSRFSQDAPFINKLMGRLLMVGVDKQEEILKTITLRFMDKLEDLSQRGINPFTIDVYEWGAKVVEDEELHSGVIRSSQSTFDEPVRLQKLQYEQEVKPIRSEALRRMVQEGNESFVQEMGASGEGLAKLLGRIREAKDEWLYKQLPGALREKYSVDRLPSVLSTLTNSSKAVNSAERVSWLIESLEAFRPGVTFSHEDLFAGEREGIITSVSFPESDDELFLLSKYRAKVAFPGDEKLRDITLATLRNQGQKLQAWTRFDPTSLDVAPHHVKRHVLSALEQYDSVPDGVLTRSQYVLSGNIFRACEIAYEQKLGAPVLFTDAEGNRQRAVLLKDRITPDLVKSLPIALDGVDMYDYAVELFGSRSNRNFRFFTSAVKDMKKGEGLMFETNDGNVFQFSMPGTKSKAGALMTDGDIFDLGEKSSQNSMRLALTGTRAFMQATVTRSDLPRFLVLLQRNKHVGKFYLPDPDHEILSVLKERFEQEKRAQSDDEASFNP